MKTLWERFHTCLRDQAPNLLDVLRPGASKAAIREAEARIGVTFPSDFVDFYSIHDGQPRESGGLINAMTISSLDRVVSNWKVLTDLLEEGAFRDVTSRPEGPSQADWWNAKWIPFVENWSGDHICLDLDPPPRGKMGQVIRFWHADVERNYEASSFRKWFAAYISAVEAGRYVYSAEYGGIVDARDA